MEDKLVLDNPIFDQFKDDFETILINVIQELTDSGRRRASIATKIDVFLREVTTEDGELIIVPEIDHKVSGKINVEAKLKGRPSGIFTITHTENGFRLKEVNKQTSIDGLGRN